MNSARPVDGARGYRLPCGEPLISLLGPPDEPRSGRCSDSRGSGRRGEFIRPVDTFIAAQAAPTLADADVVMGTLRFARPPAASLVWALSQYFRLLDGWFSATSRVSSLGACPVSARGDIHGHPGERRR